MRHGSGATGNISAYHEFQVAGFDDHLVAGAAIDDFENFGDLIIVQAHAPPLPSRFGSIVAVFVVEHRRKAHGGVLQQGDMAQALFSCAPVAPKLPAPRPAGVAPIDGTATQTTPARYADCRSRFSQLGFFRVHCQAARRGSCVLVAMQRDSAQQGRRLRGASMLRNSLPIAVQCSGTREPGSKRKPNGHADSTRSRSMTLLPAITPKLQVSPILFDKASKIA